MLEKHQRSNNKRKGNDGGWRRLRLKFPRCTNLDVFTLKGQTIILYSKKFHWFELEEENASSLLTTEIVSNMH